MDLSRFRYQGEDARELKPAAKTLGKAPRSSSKACKEQDDNSSDTKPLVPLPVLLRPGLKLVFVGFNPGIMSSEKGHYYAHPSNAFWKNLNRYIVQDGSLTCYDDSSLQESHSIGFTDLVARPTRGSEDLSREEMEKGAHILLEQLSANAPALVCIVGRGIWDMVFRAVFKHQGVKKGDLPAFGLMPLRLDRSRVFVVPSTSGLVRDKRLDLWQQLGDMYRGEEVEVVHDMIDEVKDEEVEEEQEGTEDVGDTAEDVETSQDVETNQDIKTSQEETTEDVKTAIKEEVKTEKIIKEDEVASQYSKTRESA
ncbi:G/U mismatch-specific uracil DNA glycosylase [Yarrowia sp. B02]|nr:G/U mismatch-specific uracil DNA glycosylase [Yarrowia sp. B02]